jgi:hypothetical protein
LPGIILHEACQDLMTRTVPDKPCTSLGRPLVRVWPTRYQLLDEGIGAIRGVLYARRGAHPLVHQGRQLARLGLDRHFRDQPLVTGKIGLAGTIASVEVVTKIVLYYLHERAWAIIPWGR